MSGTRAADDQMKEEIVNRLLALWKRYPDLRLMQLIGNVFPEESYYVEDYDMIEAVEGYYAPDEM